MSLPSRLLGANPSIQVSALLSGSLSTPSAKQAFIPPTSYDSISTTTLSSNQSTVTFSTISGSYQHLQLRVMVRNTRATTSTGGSLFMRFNGDSTSGNYMGHRFGADGANLSADASITSQTSFSAGDTISDSANSDLFSYFIIDIHDYADTNKYKTVRSYGGTGNDLGFFGLYSGLWRSNSAITSISFTAGAHDHKSESTFALFGIRG